ncbi:MAG: hypothetical protein A3D93_02165 [Acidobacteria bacterium RIFCSPHIGHO2_12_FULL_67_30]|nr:MAG: hypothetical protein A3B65_01615 [Acidobacteria bacterium RIFCSPHIGHO2_02_FULL_67_57]OFV85254.1 MAG: hypothetical protein A2620_04140 [Acidobacteria bacterium RIFCSPHIGHO2_01_FULL_67_28]OFV87572.1 MAG: hypothetical protein A3D93_02165 [Acidobacteria bacterium RIFCSPHIGHO2_12_FULL_67_30]
MAPTETPSGERRRSARTLQKVPVQVAGQGANGQAVNEAGEAVVISAHGALVKASAELRSGSEVELENTQTRQRARFRVIWATAKPLEGKWDMGVELQAGQAAPWAGA